MSKWVKTRGKLKPRSWVLNDNASENKHLLESCQEVKRTSKTPNQQELANHSSDYDYHRLKKKKKVPVTNSFLLWAMFLQNMGNRGFPQLPILCSSRYLCPYYNSVPVLPSTSVYMLFPSCVQGVLYVSSSPSTHSSNYYAKSFISNYWIINSFLHFL